jgi:hypothetical protein
MRHAAAGVFAGRRTQKSVLPLLSLPALNHVRVRVRVRCRSAACLLGPGEQAPLGAWPGVMGGLPTQEDRVRVVLDAQACAPW